ncbi:MAG: hypothetical protein ACKOC8_11085 [Pirellulales bacterium]
MHTTTCRDSVRHAQTTPLLSMQIDGETCSVRSTTVWPIAEVLGFEAQLETACMVGCGIDAEFVTAALESQMIVPPRPRRRRERTVASRAAFYAGG